MKLRNGLGRRAVFIGAQDQRAFQLFELTEDLRELGDVAGVLGETPPLARAVRLHHLEDSLRQARQIDERDFARRGGVARHAVIVRPAPGISATLRKAGVDAFLHLVPFGIINDLGADLDLLLPVVEVQRRHLSGGHVAVHGAQIAARFTAGGLRDFLRPFLVKRLGRGVIANLAGAILGFRRRDAIDEALLRIDLDDQNEHVEV